MQKFNRRYKCLFSIGQRENFEKKPVERKIEIAYPTTLQLSIEFGCYQTSQQGVLRFYNINPDYQKLLWKESYDSSKYIEVQLYAGYGDKMPLIFAGDIMKCYTARKGGETDFITEMEVSAAPEVFKSGFANMTISKGADESSIINDLFQGVPEIGIGYITKELGKLPKTTAYIGNPMDIIKNAYGSKYQIFIENGLLNILAEGEVKKDMVLTVTAESGLLGSPKRSGAMTEAEMIFEPNATVGGLVNVLSDSMPDINGTFKCLNVKHQGTISSNDCGTLTTKLTLSTGKNIFLENGQIREVSPYTQEVWNGNPVVDDWQKPVNGKVTSPFVNSRYHPIDKVVKPHTGVDIAADEGTPIYPATNAINVAFAGEQSGYGKCVQLNHGSINGKYVTTFYAHLSEIKVSTNTGKLGLNESLGNVGQTGKANGPHLHFEVRENNVKVPPGKYVKGL